MAIVYPVDCDTSTKKTEWLYRAQELLRLLHNKFGEWYREGLIEDEYNQFPSSIKTKYSYKPQLDKTSWNKFINEDFVPRSEKICAQILIHRKMLKESTNWVVNIGDI